MKGVLDDGFAQLRDVSSMFMQQLRDSSRRNFGIQTSAEFDSMQQVPPQAESSSEDYDRLHVKAGLTGSAIGAGVGSAVDTYSDDFDLEGSSWEPVNLPGPSISGVQAPASYSVPSKQDLPHSDSIAIDIGLEDDASTASSIEDVADDEVLSIDYGAQVGVSLLQAMVSQWQLVQLLGHCQVLCHAMSGYCSCCALSAWLDIGSKRCGVL